MHHMLRLILIAVPVALLLVPATPPSPALAATFTVSSFADERDDNPGDGICRSTVTRSCTLRAAIMEANARFAWDTINLPRGTFSLTISGLDDTAAQGDLDITSSVTINGAGPALTVIDASSIAPQRDRVFDVHPGAELALNGLRITGGQLQSGFAGGDGGGIRVHGGKDVQSAGDARLVNVLVNGNQAGVGAGIAVRANGFFSLADSTIDDNQATSDGGGISVVDGLLMMWKSTVSRNTSGRSGGGIQYVGSWIIVENSTISMNTAATNGGGLFLDLKVRNADSGRPYYNGFHLTVAHNAASYAGSGANIYVDSARGAPQYDLRKSIVAKATRGGNCGGQLVASGGFNLEDKNSCGFSAMGDIVNVSPMLGALRIDNSVTEVHPLPSTSPAVDASDCMTSSDQRSVLRPQDGDQNGNARCDIGAYELENQQTPAVRTVSGR
jgi:CSLREA domain-containing protein